MADPLENDLKALIDALKESKGDERTPRARAIAVTITMLEKALAYYVHFVVNGNAGM